MSALERDGLDDGDRFYRVEGVEGSEPRWVPLERFLHLAAAAGMGLAPTGPLDAVLCEVDDGGALVGVPFMWMGAYRRASDGHRIELYKHRDTRRYLNLDDAGHAWVYRGGVGDEGCSYVPLASLASAVAGVLS